MWGGGFFLIKKIKIWRIFSPPKKGEYTIGIFLFLTHNLAQEKKGRYQSVGAGSHKARRRE